MAGAITPRAEPNWHHFIDQTADAQGLDVPTDEFVVAVELRG